MGQERRTVRFDDDIKVEAYRFEGVMQKFPNHFHEHYVLGFIESGRRRLCCQNTEYTIDTGDLTIFNPFDNHACEQIDAEPLDYRCVNIGPEVMAKKAFDITGIEYQPRFTLTVAFRSDAAEALRELHAMIMQQSPKLEKEQAFYFLIEHLIHALAAPPPGKAPEVSESVQGACEYMDKHFAQAVSLDDLSALSGLNKYTLLRNFTKQLGITPYQYLQTVRANASKKLLENGAEPIEAAMQAGFSDQSHFTKCFKSFIGLTPRQYRDIFKN